MRSLAACLALACLLALPASANTDRARVESDRTRVEGDRTRADSGWARVEGEPEFPGLLPVKLRPEPPIELELKLPGVRRVVLEPHPEGLGYEYRVTRADGESALLSPAAFADLSYRHHARRVWWRQLFNISSAFNLTWVAVGLVGQLLFMGRMLVQWVTSEREKRSVVPELFWWLSLGGASMLLVYFIWRKDIVGVLGQGAGWLIYARNLYLIRQPPTHLSSGPTND